MLRKRKERRRYLTSASKKVHHRCIEKLQEEKKYVLHHGDLITRKNAIRLNVTRCCTVSKIHRAASAYMYMQTVTQDIYHDNGEASRVRYARYKYLCEPSAPSKYDQRWCMSIPMYYMLFPRDSEIRGPAKPARRYIALLLLSTRGAGMLNGV